MGSTPRFRPLGLLLACALAAGLALGGGTVEAKGGAPAKPLPKGGEGAAVAPDKPSLRPIDSKAAKEYKDLVEAGRMYFDTLEDLWVGHKEFRNALQEYAKEDVQLLADFDFLRWLVAQSRSFKPQMDDRKWTRSVDVNFIDHRASGFELKGGQGPNKVWMHVREPKSYPKRNRDLEKFVRVDPYPTLLLLHEKSDTSKADGAGESALERAYPKGTFPEIAEDWISMVPIAAAAAYVKDGVIRRSSVLDPLRMLWNHYHVDFDRIVVDGGTDVLTLLGGSASFFAGGVIRSAALDTDKLKASVINYAHVPLYVIDDDKLAAELRDRGHPNVTSGKADAALTKWMMERERIWPKSFEWRLVEGDQSLAWWINVDQAVWSDTAERTLKVECLDTEADPNTIKISATKLSEISLFLSDAIVDLDRKVRVVINGRVMYDQAAVVPDHMAPISRNMQTLFLHETLDVRKSRYYGWLMGLVIPRLEVPDAPKVVVKEEPVEPVVAATPRQEAAAGKLFDKAKRSCAAGDHDEGRRLLDRALKLPLNAFTEQIRAMRERLGDGDAGK